MWWNLCLKSWTFLGERVLLPILCVVGETPYDRDRLYFACDQRINRPEREKLLAEFFRRLHQASTIWRTLSRRLQAARRACLEASDRSPGQVKPLRRSRVESRSVPPGDEVLASPAWEKLKSQPWQFSCIFMFCFVLSLRGFVMLIYLKLSLYYIFLRMIFFFLTKICSLNLNNSITTLTTFNKCAYLIQPFEQMANVALLKQSGLVESDCKIQKVVISIQNSARTVLL